MGILDKIKSTDISIVDKKIHPIDIFKSLTKTIDYEYLRGVQEEFLNKWWQTKDTRDIVGVVNTGSGKTLIGLLMLYSKMNEGVGPVVYLCPDNQLVDQVLLQSKLHGIPAVTISEGSGRRRQEFPVEFINSEAILVTTFEKLYNGKSIFGVVGTGYREIQEVGALLVDDAHSCINKIRKQSTFSIPAGNKMYSEILNLFSEDLEKQGLSYIHGIKKGEQTIARVVPYWAYHAKFEQLKNIIENNHTNENFQIYIPFDLIYDYLDKSDCYISANSIEITPLQIPLEKLPSYHDAKFRFIMSATFNNSEDLITELGIDRESVLNPVTIEDDTSLGERLIISPNRYSSKITDDLIRKMVRHYSEENNVIVLVPSRKKAEEWVEIGATLVDRQNISEVIKKLKESKDNFFVLLNRYDGIDLKGEMCNLLVLDGLPDGSSIRNRANNQVRVNSKVTKRMITQTIEQGFGRAVRSGSDYCITLLMDSSLLNFVSNNSNRKYFSNIARAQLDLGIELSSDFLKENKPLVEAVKEIMDSINLVLSRDSAWIDYYKRTIDIFIKNYESNSQKNAIELAVFERNALTSYKENKIEQAISILNDKILSSDSLSQEDKGWYFQMAGRILFILDSTRANDLQVKAKEHNRYLLIPTTSKLSKKTKNATHQAVLVKEWMNEFSNGTDLKLAIDALLANLDYSPTINSNSFEASIEELGTLLGYESTRPDKEYNDGPDNLWITDGVSLLIECKNEAVAENFSRENIEQLLHTIEWYDDHYHSFNEVFALGFHKSNELFNNAHASNATLSVNSNMLTKLKDKVESFSLAISQKSPSEYTVKEIENLLRQNGLMGNQFIQNFTIKFK